MGVTIIAAIFFIVVVLTIVFFYIKYTAKETDVPEDSVMFEHYILPSKYTHSHSEGFIIKQIRGAKRTLFVFRPKDINYVASYNNKSKKIEDEKIYVRNDLILSVPKGSKSERNKIIALPCRSDSLPDEMPEILKTKFSEIIEKHNSEKHKTDVLMERLKRTENLNIEDCGGTPSLDFISNFKENANDYYKSISSSKQDNKTGSFGAGMQSRGM